MAEENIIVEQRAVSTASFNLNTRVLTIPTFKSTVSAEILDVLFSHEISHALYTNREIWRDTIENLKIPKSVVNVLEDARIEKLIKRKYPGLKPSYIKGYNELIELGLFGEEVKEDNIDSFNVLDKVNLFFKIGHIRNYNYGFNEIELDFIKRISKMETMQDVVEVSKDFSEYLKEVWKAEYEQGEFEFDPEFGQDGQEYEFDEDGNAIESSEDKYKVFRNNGTPLQDILDSLDSEDFDIVSELDENFKSSECELYSDECIGYIDVVDNVHENNLLDYKRLYEILKTLKLLSSHSPQNYMEFKKKSNPVVNYLVKEFELKKNADRFKKAKIAKSGDICSKKIYSYKFNENIFKKISIVPDAKSHGLIFFLDWSGSMAKIINQTIEQLMNLVLFCKKVNIPYEVYAFSTQNFPKAYDGNVKNPYDMFEKKFSHTHKNIVYTNNFTLINFLSSKMSNREFVQMSNFLLSVCFNTYPYLHYSDSENITIPYWLCLDGTPLNECIINAIDIVNNFKSKNNLQIVNTVFLTDGEGAFPNCIDFSSIENTVRQSSIGRTANRCYIRYNKYKEEVHLSTNKKYSHLAVAFETSKAFITLFKKCTGSNLIGFYIAESGCKELLNAIYGNEKFDEIEKMKAEYKKYGCLAIEDSGYDEYYLIRKNKLKMDDSELVLEKSSTVRSLAKKFSNHIGRKLDSRIVLQKFIKKIC